MLKLLLEIGHVAQRKKIIENGFTHDWELFVRSPSPDGDLSFIVEKIIFNLHNTFIKPRRTIKEPPFVVRESGYAGFVVLIEIYLRNKEKITLNYDLDLQNYKSEIREFTINSPISDEFRKKCIKSGCIQTATQQQQKDTITPSSSSYKSTNSEVKKPSKTSHNSMFTDLFGAPIEKTQIPPSKTISKTTATTTGPDKILNTQPTTATTTSSSSAKEKSSKHKHVSDNKDAKKSTENSRSEKVKKDKTKDRDRSDKKEKSSKRTSSSPSRAGIQSTATTSSKTQIALVKPQTTIQDTSASSSGSKGKKNERDKSDKKEYLKSSKEKASTSSTSTTTVMKQGKSESKSNILPSSESAKKHNSSNKDLERKHKHKKKEKYKEKEGSRFEKERKNQKSSKTSIPSKDKSHLSDKDSNSDSDKNEKEIIHDGTPEKRKKSSRDEKGSTTKGLLEKDDKQSKRKLTKDDRDSSASPPLPKQSKRDFSPTTVVSEKNLPDSHATTTSDVRVSNEYIDELKDLKQKINTLQTKELHHVVRLIASTGFYEITHSSFNFDLAQLDKNQPGIISQLNKLVAANSEDKKEAK